MDKNQAVWEFISKCPALPAELSFNTISEMVNATGLMPVSSEANLAEYIDGSARREYIFMIVSMQNYDDVLHETNLIAMQDVQEIMDWLEAQNEAGNYPDFGPGCCVEEIEPLQNMPDLAGVDNSMIAKIMFQCRIIYEEER